MISNSHDFIQFTGTLGKLYRQHRRGLPSVVQVAFRDLLRTVGTYFKPSVMELTICRDIRVARGDIADAMESLAVLARRVDDDVPVDCDVK